MATLQQVAIGGIIFLAIFTGLVIVQTDFIDVYDLSPNDRYFDNMTKNTSEIEQYYNLTQDITSKFKSQKGDQSNLDTSVVGGLNAIKKILDLFDIIKKVINLISITLHVPTWIVNVILSGILITVVLAVISAFLGRRTD